MSEHTHENCNDENCGHEHHEHHEPMEFEALPPEMQVAHLTMTLMQMTKEAANLVYMIEQITGMHAPPQPSVPEGQATLDEWTDNEEE